MAIQPILLGYMAPWLAFFYFRALTALDGRQFYTYIRRKSCIIQSAQTGWGCSNSSSMEQRKSTGCPLYL